ncbi:hypothetical protein ACTG15_07570 [Aeromonas sp. 164P]
MVADDDVLPATGADQGGSDDTARLASLLQFAGFPGRPLQRGSALVSDIEIDSFSMRNTIVMLLPLHPSVGARRIQLRELFGIDIAVDEAFNDVLRPFNTINTNRTNISLKPPSPAAPGISA